MSSNLDYVKYICEQMSDAGNITYKKMFGDYTIYCDSKVLGLICDNQVFIKPTEKGQALIPDAIKESPYKGAKPYILLEDFDDKDFITKFIIATCIELPFPKPRKK
ncbi:TfoX/Sxy family protein [Anaerovorax odorimutans]|uniref:TfoX/Sxy family protein n=1 Tax=Anaerovorax odorimutans TaxID=109327 RepID=UPI0003FB6D94|nr:TfoX/Sxy family protein [Anaerovorax odorimutans]